MSTNYVAQSPYCEHQLDPSTAVDGWVTCPCGHRSDARWVSELGWLQARKNFVDTQVRDSVAWFDSSRASSAASAPTQARGASGQGVLYVLGALSLVTAFVVFTAVAWQSIGAVGQGAVLIGGSLVSAFVAFKSRVKLAGLANTFAFISTAIAAVFFLNAPIVGLFPEAWQRVEDGYPLAVLVGLSLISAVLGFRFKISGWIFVSTASALPAWLMLNQAVVRTHLGDAQVLASSVISGFIFLVLLEFLSERLLLANSEWKFAAVLNSITQAMITFVVVSSSTAEVVMSQQPVVDSAAYALAGVGFYLIHLKWKRPEGSTFLFTLLRSSSLVFSALTLGLASAWVFSAPQNWEYDYPSQGVNLWIQLLPAAALGATAFIVSTFRKTLSGPHRLFLTVYGITVWVFGYLLLFSRAFTGSYSYEAITYFAIIALTSLVCWLTSNNVLQFIASIASGAMAVIVFMQTQELVRFEGPEQYTVPVALWFVICLTLLHRRSEHLNSAVWFGIPFGTILIPSAASAIALVQSNPGANLNWVRFWTVLVVSLVGAISAARFRFAGVLVPSAIAYVLVTFPQLFVDLQLIVPRWVFFAILGGLLIVIAARFERLQQLRKETGSWSEVFR